MRFTIYHWTFLSILTLTQAAIIILRLSWSGVAYYRLVRIHNLVNAEFVMIVGSVFIWRRISSALSSLDPERITPVKLRWRTICLHDVARASLIVFLLMSHASFTFYFFLLGSEPHLLAIISLTAVATYLHIFVFLIIVEGIYFSSSLSVQFGILTSFNRYIIRNRENYSLLALFCALLFIFGGLYSTFKEPVYTRVQIPMRKFTSSSQELKIALLTDIHIGPTVGERRMKIVVKLTNDLNADILAISGDLADGFVQDFESAARPLCSLKAKYGVYFATGNHEYMHGNVEEWFDYLEACNITVLHNANRRILLDGGDSVCIAGTDDLFAARSHFPGHLMDPNKALAGCLSDDTIVVLAHQPNAARVILSDSNINRNVDLILSGHTHGGQMYMFIPIVYFMNAFTRGLYQHPQTGAYVYVSAGVNYFGPPIKIFGACEIIDIKLKSMS